MNFAGKTAGILAKGVGAAGLALVVYDSHKAGKLEAPKNEKAMKAENLTEHYMNDMKLESTSHVQSEVKKRIFKFYADENISSFFTSTGGYAKGFGAMLVQNVVPFGLSVGALFTKGIVSRLSGLGLVAYGGIFLLQEAFGIGKSHK